MPLRVVVLAEFYPRPLDPAWGIWAHRQALAVRDQEVDVRVVALERPVPPLRVFRAGGFEPLREWAARMRRPPRDTRLDGISVRYARFVSPPRPLTYPSWGRWAARPVARALEALRQEGRIDLIHAHYAVPAGDAALRWMARAGRAPLVVSVHGGDLSYTAARSGWGRATVRRVLGAADAVIANSEVTRRGIEELTGPLPRLEVIHPGADLPAGEAEPHEHPTLVTVAHLEAHKNQAAVIRAVAALKDRHPAIRYRLIGKGPARASLEQLAASLGVREGVSFEGALAHERALAEVARCHVHVMPSTHDAFGVAHIEAMAAGLPSIGGAGTGAEDIAAAGEGMLVVPPGDQRALVRSLDGLLSDERERARLGSAARRTVAGHFTWARNGTATAALYRQLVEQPAA